MTQLNFYTTLGCHLCDNAHELLQTIEADIEINTIEIADDDALIEQYGTQIPVITINGTSNMIQWPFTIEDLTYFIQDN